MNRSVGALALLLLACVILAAPAPKQFAPGWGKPVDPDKDCKINRGEGWLIIEMPGTLHDFALWANPKRANAPRLMRNLVFEGDFALEVRTQIDCRASAESSLKGQPSYVSAGFLVLSPDSSYNILRAEYRVEGQGDGVDGWIGYETLGANGGVPVKQHPKWPLKARPDYVYQRLERWGNSLNHTFSSDGKKWIPMGGSNWVQMPSKLKVGLLACSTSTDPSKVRFDQFKHLPVNKKREPWEFTSDWGKPVDPDKDCKIKRDKDALTIEMPGSDHDYDPTRKRFNAPRLISDLEGRFDLQVRVRIDYRPSAQSTVKGQPSFVSAGFLLIYPDDLKFPEGGDICTRLEYAISQQGTKPEAYAVAPVLVRPRRKNPAPTTREPDSYAIMKNWSFESRRTGDRSSNFEWDHAKLRHPRDGMWERGWQNWPWEEKAEYAYLRLDHREDGSCVYISPDGEKWTRLTYLHSLPEKGKLALAAYSTSTEPSKVRFDQLKLARDK